MMPTYIATFCNTGTARFAILNEEKIERVCEVDHNLQGAAILGTTGVTIHNSDLAIGLQSISGAIALVNRDLAVKEAFFIDEARDIHGVCSLDNSLALVSSGTGQILSFDTNSRTTKPVWFDGIALSDISHLNDIVFWNNSIFFSQFGIRRPNEMRDGKVMELPGGRSLARGLREPHSPAIGDQDIYVLESATGDLLRLRDGFAPERVLGISGYARGLWITPKHFIVGKSGYRGDSRHRLGDSRPIPFVQSAAASDTQKTSGIFIIDRASLSARFIDTTAIGLEIYQIIELPEGFLEVAPTGIETKPPEETDKGVNAPTAAARSPAHEPSGGSPRFSSHLHEVPGNDGISYE